MITKETNEKQLLETLGEMVKPLKDGHINILKGEEVIASTKLLDNWEKI